MKKSTGAMVSYASAEWDPKTKKSWFIEFEQEPVDDEKWTCIVTAAVPNEAKDEEYIQTYTECVNTGLRNVVKIISMADVIKLLKENNAENSKKEDKTGKLSSKMKTRGGNFQVLELAAEYATYTGLECKLPPDLMAAVIKYIILNLKEESCLRIKAEAVKERRIREQCLIEKFIRNRKPYEVGYEDEKMDITPPQNVLELEGPISDEPVDGPDLYVLLTDFYDVYYFTALQIINVPFMAVLRISTQEIWNTFNGPEVDVNSGRIKKTVVAEFWQKLSEEFLMANGSKCKDIAIIEYRAPPKSENRTENYRQIFDELTWTQYSVYRIQRQHHKYLQELHVQRQIVALEPLDLSKCTVYNKLCDALVTGEPLTPLMVLYAIVEQVVVGVPFTFSTALEYQPKMNQFLAPSSDFAEQKPRRSHSLVSPFAKCNEKKPDSNSDGHLYTSKGEWTETSDENSVSQHAGESSVNSTKESDEVYSAYESLITKVLTERKTEKEIREDRRWKTPSLCFYGDFVHLQTFHCDPRLIDSETIVDRFLKNSRLPTLWKNHPRPPPEERAFYNFHFNSFLKISEQNEELLKLKIFFMLSMNLLGEKFQEGETASVCYSKLEVAGVNMDQKPLSILKEGKKNFQNYFLKTFIAREYFKNIGESNLEPAKEQSHSRSQNVLRVTPISGGICSTRLRDLPIKATSSVEAQILNNFYSVLNCFHISNLKEGGKPPNEEFLSLIQDFKFFEKLEPNLMIQRLVDAEENFNSTKISYFAPTDTLIVVLLNDFDSRGVFSSKTSASICTPVGFRDFYHHIYPEISDWLIDEELEYARFVWELREEEKARKEKRDKEFLEQLREKYCSMNERKRIDFLEMGVGLPEISHKAVEESPLKPRQIRDKKVSFFATNLTDVRVENKEHFQEFYSQDGTQVSVSVESWLYDPLELLRLRVKQSNFSLYYNQWIGYPTTTHFTLKTNSDIIFSFHKDGNSNNSVTISWPTGLIIQPVHHVNGIFIKQRYLKAYRKGWEIEEEKSRCLLRNGNVLVLKKNGDYDILFGSGTKYSFYNSATVPRYEIISTTGEVWQIRKKGPCKNRKTFVTLNKIFLGVDSTSKEVFYKREDGTYFMLWRNGKLVTNFPDGTKITTTPYFEEEEATTDWTEEEKIYYEQLASKIKLEQKPRSRTILRNSSPSRSTSGRSFTISSFVVVSCAYLMEHPKYSGVCFNPNDPYVRLTLPEEITVRMYPSGKYEIQKDSSFMLVEDGVVELCRSCPDCMSKNTVKVYLDSTEILCKCTDFFHETFFVYRNGSTVFYENSRDTNSKCDIEPEMSITNSQKCAKTHAKDESLMQRCFALERDLSGVEFLHLSCLSCHFYQLPETTYYELSTEDPSNICHASNSPYHKIGYEKWMMDYEERSDSFPTNLKKKDLKEMGVKQVTRNVFSYPFPKNNNHGNHPQNEKVKPNVKEPRVIVSRMVRCLSQNPNSVIEELRGYAKEYDNKAAGIFSEYENFKVDDMRPCDSRYVDMRLKKIAVTLAQSLRLYPHLCTTLPSTEKDIHYFGHFINSAEGIRSHFGGYAVVPDCKQIPERLPGSGHFSSLDEETETPKNT